MSGCHNTSSQCCCLCHSTGFPHIKTSNPPQPCCPCSPFSPLALSKDGFGDYRNEVHPLQKQLDTRAELIKSMRDEISVMQKQIDATQEFITITNNNSIARAEQIEKRLEALEQCNATVDDDLAENGQAIERVSECTANIENRIKADINVCLRDHIKRIEGLEGCSKNMLNTLDHHQRMHEDHYANNERAKENIQLLTQAQDTQCELIDSINCRLIHLEDGGQFKHLDSMFSDYNARIEKLETDLKILRTSKIINDVSAASAFEAINLPTIKDRIEKLEMVNNPEMQLIVQAQDTQCEQIDNLTKSREAHSNSNKELFERVEKLEANLAEAMKMEWTSTPLNNLAVQFVNQGARITKLEQKPNDDLHNEALSYSNELAERVNKLADCVVLISGRVENLELFNTQRMNEIAGSERELAKWIGEHGKRIEKLEDKDKYHDRVCGNLRNLIDKLEQRISLQEKYYRHQEIESPQKCNPELDGAVDADELHQAIQNLSDAFIVFKKGRE